MGLSQLWKYIHGSSVLHGVDDAVTVQHFGESAVLSVPNIKSGVFALTSPY